METTTINDDINIMYVTATSFPDGIKAAHKKLHNLVPVSNQRKYFGLSRPENGMIVYKAAAEEIKKGEAESLHLERLIIRKGNYVSLIINDFMKDGHSIKNAFEQLLEYPGLDPQGYCVEWYLSLQDVKCMIRLDN